MKNITRYSVFMLTLATITIMCATFAGCNRNTKTNSSPINLNWINIFYRDRGIILTGNWENAESTWVELKHHGSQKWNDSDLKQWLDFQVEILERTSSNSLLENVHIMAVQEFGYYPQMYSLYAPWLKSSIATNLFARPLVLKKAKEVIAKGG